jgi:methylglutamate dehydrogenase subunit D
VADVQLKPRAVLGGYALQQEGISLTELVDFAVWSLACQSVRQGLVTERLQAAFGVTWPQVGSCSVSNDSSIHVLGLQQDQVFVVSENKLTSTTLGDIAGEAAWCTEQSDSWVSLKLAGDNRYKVLERTCSIDLDPDVFADGQVARTSMEHLSTILYRQGDSFILMSPSSSARGFIHMLEESIRFID